MKILLFAPSQTILPNQIGMGLYPPLGLASIASYINLRGWKVKIVDCYAEGLSNISIRNGYKRIGLREEQIIRYIQSFSPNIIGIGCNFTNFSQDLFELAKLCKQCSPNVLLIAGGAHPSMDAMNVISNKYIDIIVRGEGEKVVGEICERYAQGKSLTFIPGTVTKYNGKIVENPFRAAIDPLDELPMPSYEHLKMELYLQDQVKNRRLPFVKKVPVGFIVSSRGCRYSCSYCSTSKVFGKHRTHSPSYVLKVIKYLVAEYSVKEIAFCDDCFNGDIERVNRICNMLIEENMEIPWTVSQGLMVNLINKQLLLKMKKAGFYRACFSIDTGSSEIAKYIRRHIDLRRAKRIITECNRLGIYTVGNFIIGFPYETMRHINETIRYAMDSDLDIINVYICQPHSGAELYNIFKKENCEGKDLHIGSNFFFTRYNTKYFNAGDLNKIRKECLIRFLKKRLCSIFTIRGFYIHILSKVKSPADMVYLVRFLFRFMLALITRRGIAI